MTTPAKIPDRGKLRINPATLGKIKEVAITGLQKVFERHVRRVRAMVPGFFKKKDKDPVIQLPEGTAGPLLLILAASLKNICTRLTMEVRTDDPELKKLSTTPGQKNPATGNPTEYAIRLVVERKAPAAGMEKMKIVLAQVYPKGYEQAITQQ